MITYVNTVLVSNANGDTLATKAEIEGKATAAEAKALAGKFAFMNCDPDCPSDKLYEVPASNDFDTFKIGVVTEKNTLIVNKQTGQKKYVPFIRWSNEIKTADIKSLTKLTYSASSEDVVEIDFNSMDAATQNLVAQGNINIIFRIQYKDIPARYRKWTESYNYVTKLGDDAAKIATEIAKTINLQEKRARVIAEANAGKVTLTAMEYDDDLADDTENPTAKVRFNVNLYYTNPVAPGWASNNKYELLPATAIVKTPGVTYPASDKLVREHERNARGYMGAVHTCKWYDPKPAMTAILGGQYSGFTLEFENMYRAADDIFRKTKQTVEVYATNGTSATINTTNIAGGLLAKLKSAIDNRQKLNAPIDNSAAYDTDTYAQA